MGNFKEVLKNIKPSLEVNKDLKIANLENEKAHLLAQVNKYKKIISRKQNVKAGTTFTTRKDLNIAQREREKSFKAQIERQKEINRSNRARNHKITLYCNFLERRIKQLYGLERFKELVNTTDNPNPERIRI